MTRSWRSRLLLSRRGRALVLVAAFCLTFSLLEHWAPYRSPAQLVVSAAVDRLPFQAQVGLHFTKRAGYTETFAFDRSPADAATAALHLPPMDIPLVGLRSLEEGRPLQLRSVHVQIDQQVIEVPCSTRGGLSTIDLAAAEIYRRRIGFHPLLFVAHLLLALSGAWAANQLWRIRHCLAPAAEEPKSAPQLPAKRQRPQDTAVVTGTSPLLRRSALLGPLFLGLSVGTQSMFAFFILIGPYRQSPWSSQLTEMGARLYKPEYDLPIYVAGCALSVLLSLAAAWWWNRWLGRLEPVVTAALFRHALVYSFGFQVLVSLLGLLLFLLLVLARYAPFPFRYPPLHSAGDIIPMFVPAAATIVLTVLELGRIGRGAGQPLTPPCGVKGQPSDRPSFWRCAARAGLDVAVPALVIGVVYIPAQFWASLAGRSFLKERLLHWSYFAMNPAVAWDSGMALGTEAYTQYGAGWPLLFAGLAPLMPLSYSNMIGAGAIVACVYYIGTYLFLRAVLGSTTWAGAGALLGLLLQMFNGIEPNDVPWRHPSSTCLRHPVDVWFFLLLWLHLRSDRLRWALLAGLVCGLGILFEADTGFYLLATLLVYLALKARRTRLTAAAYPARRSAAAALVSLVSVLSALAGGLALASRGTLFSASFWTGYTECLRVYAGRGASLLPIAGASEGAIIVFLFMVMVSLLVAAFLLGRIVFQKSAAPDDVLLTCLGLYSLASLVLFVGRSYQFNLYHCAVPFVLTLVIAACRAGRSVSARSRNSLLPAAALGLIAAWLLTDPTYRDYPGLLRTSLRPEPVPVSGVYLLSDRDDIYLPGSYATAAEQVNHLGHKLSQLAQDGSSIAILDDMDTLLCLAGHLRPWGRYLFILSMLHTRAQVDAVNAALRNERPRYVVVQADESQRAGKTAPVSAAAGQVLRGLRDTIAGLYQRIDTVGLLEIWERKQ